MKRQSLVLLPAPTGRVLRVAGDACAEVDCRGSAGGNAPGLCSRLCLASELDAGHSFALVLQSDGCFDVDVWNASGKNILRQERLKIDLAGVTAGELTELVAAPSATQPRGFGVRRDTLGGFELTQLLAPARAGIREFTKGG